MANLNIDLSLRGGKIKPMNAVNNGPTSSGVRKASNTNFDAYKALHIPYARNHDASFYSGYGGEHTVDVHRIFKNFSADENDPASYIFEPTDAYIKNTLDANTKIFYRLGASIEHEYKYGTRVPPDFEKWARICEHIIRHYNEGWANGFEYGIEYWEIWNEPDCHNADGSNPCWQGTNEEFADFFDVAVRYLKKTFPNLKIGGPAIAGLWWPDSEEILAAIFKRKTPLDFLSYHWYGKEMGPFTESLNKARELLDSHGYNKTETILNEWNYIYGWSGDDWNYSLATEKNIKGASFVLAAMLVAQNSPLDMLMYYDARPCGMNGLFVGGTAKCLKPYYSFRIFDELRTLGTQIPMDVVTDDIYAVAATNGKVAAIALTYYNNDDTKEEKEVKISFKNITGKKKVTCSLLDDNHDLVLTREEIFTTNEFSLYLRFPLFTSYLVKIEDLEA